jgi:hypothetical protein
MRGFATFALDEYGSPVTRLYYDCDESSEAQLLEAQAGNPSVVEYITYRSPGNSGQAWYVSGLDASFGRLDGSLTSDTGPWTDLAGGLADPSSAGTAKTLWLRYVAHRWAPDDDNPRQSFSLTLRSRGEADTDSD